MQTALFVLLVLAAADVAACLVLFVLVWVEHRRVRREAAEAGQPIPSAAGQLGCLVTMAVAGLGGLYLAAWLLLNG